MMASPTLLQRCTRRAGFALPEVLVAIGIFALAMPTLFYGLLHNYRTASLNRIYTAALAVARSEVEAVRALAPFNPQLGQFPPQLALGTTTTQNVPIYVDPADSSYIVAGTLTRSTTDPGLSQGGTNLNLRRVTVTVTFQNLGRTHSVSLTTMRSSDQ